ncbi:hypothetical protein GWK41_10000 [Persephonella atlantica]|uniref:Uncharacterized protein n=1 Tax=Persephonella atlantica TaxID=2699429 RepID=A0ABS1GKT1_9AQUI|nr:hypothetical protein [Persephonella atlantica]MBK3333396.1 hypothetical protein [Persephonella atlantica]
MITRQSSVFYVASAVFLLDKNLLGLLIFSLLGFVAVVILHYTRKDKYEDIERPLSYENILVFKDKHELVDAILDRLLPETQKKAGIKIDIKKTAVLMLIYTGAVLLFVYSFGKAFYLFLLIGNIFLITEGSND